MTTYPQADPLIGKLVDGRYRVRARIARGGMATVYVATDLRLERRIALKVMHGHLSDDSMFQSRFIQEARAAARLADPNVVNVYDQGQDGELAYLVMEYLPGITLRELLREQRRLTLEQTVTIMDAVLSGLAAAHRAGIVHRDVKPENVLLAEDGRIKIGDFGLARASSANTATGQQLLGTIAYLAPELVTRGTADARSDIYALGIMLYEMLTGEQPYKGEQPMQIAFQHATESVPRPSIRNAAIPESLDELVLWATERSPDDRPDDAREMLDRLREIESELGISPLTAPPMAPNGGGGSFSDSLDLTKVMPGAMQGSLASTAPTVAVDSHEDNASRLRRRAARRRSRGAWLLVLVLLLAAAAGGAGWWFGSGPGSLVTVPDVAGGGYEAAEIAIVEADLLPIRKAEHSLSVDKDVVIRTSPDAGERLERGAQVEVFVSLGPEEVTLPELRGKTRAEIEEIFRSAVIEIEPDAAEFFSDLEQDQVLTVFVQQAAEESATECTNGCTVLQGSTARLTISLGPVPDVVGETFEDAQRILGERDLRAEPEEVFHSEVAEGRVIEMLPRESGLWQPEDTITLVVSKGPELFEVPNVVGLTRDEAVKRLRDAGFVVAGIGFPWNIAINGMTEVESQSPGRGAMREAGTTVRIDLKVRGG